MENNKSLGVIVVLAVAVIVGLILFQAIAANVEQSTQSNTGAITSISIKQSTGNIASGSSFSLYGISKS